MIFLACIVVGIIALTVVYAINESTARKSIVELDSLSKRLLDADMESPETAELIAEIEQFAEDNSKYAGSQAYNIVASYHADKKAWDLAEAAWLKSAAKSPKDFLAPSAMFNAAVAAEEQGNNTKAIDYYTQAAEYEGVFAGVVRSYWAIGRLYEAENNSAAALEIYQKMADDYPDDELTKLAQSRIIVLSN
ncbi:MAG: tetratricopeptide repeat protein [Treponema sp.]|nr:tetratricopeptide repeat protein [Treponema sp.]